MKRDLNTYDVNRILAQARQERSAAAGQLIVSGSRKALGWLAARTDKVLHAFLMSPTVPR